jgi:SOS-response transcriptional repressor LexA
MVEIPVVGRVSAGSGGWYVDPDHGTIWVPEKLAELGTIAKMVDGDSQSPWLWEDDAIVFREWRRPKKGKAFLIRMPDGEDRIKLTYHNGREWELRSVNEDSYPAEPLGEAQLVGMAVGLFRIRGTRETLDSDPEGIEPDWEVIHALKKLFTQNNSA